MKGSIAVLARGLALLVLIAICAACGSDRGHASSARHSAGSPSATASVSHAQTNAGAARPKTAGGLFAGFIWQGGLTSMGASWIVPTVRPQSPLGRASTWIGAQAPSGADGAPFIQVGTQEELRSGTSTFSPAERYYEAFFSDSARGDHPVPLFRVSPGDRISAGLRLVDHRWIVSVTDHATRARLSFPTRQDAASRFDDGQFMQEDVTDGLTDRAEPYPSLTTTAMSALRVNGAAPLYASLDSAWLALPQGFLAPTPLVGDAFRIVPRALSGAAAHFLTITAPFNAEDASFGAQLSRWTDQGVSTLVLARATDQFIAVLSTLVAELRAGDWPADAKGLIDREADIYAAQIPPLRRADRRGPESVSAVFPRSRVLTRDEAVNHLIDRRIGIQEVP